MEDPEEIDLEQMLELNERSGYVRKLTRHQISEINKMVNVNEKEKNLFNGIDEFLACFRNHFPHLTNEMILDLLQKNSFDVENAYLQMKDYKRFEGIYFIFRNLIYFLFL